MELLWRVEDQGGQQTQQAEGNQRPQPAFCRGRVGHNHFQRGGTSKLTRPAHRNEGISQVWRPLHVSGHGRCRSFEVKCKVCSHAKQRAWAVQQVIPITRNAMLSPLPRRFEQRRVVRLRELVWYRSRWVIGRSELYSHGRPVTQWQTCPRAVAKGGGFRGDQR